VPTPGIIPGGQSFLRSRVFFCAVVGRVDVVFVVPIVFVVVLFGGLLFAYFRLSSLSI
jgi:hypothetical protein